jgi:hypothetical protein
MMVQVSSGVTEPQILSLRIVALLWKPARHSLLALSVLCLLVNIATTVNSANIQKYYINIQHKKTIHM